MEALRRGGRTAADPNAPRTLIGNSQDPPLQMGGVKLGWGGAEFLFGGLTRMLRLPAARRDRQTQMCSARSVVINSNSIVIRCLKQRFITMTRRWRKSAGREGRDTRILKHITDPLDCWNQFPLGRNEFLFKKSAFTMMK